jgi:protein involved in plasmid replication-relaxation
MTRPVSKREPASARRATGMQISHAPVGATVTEGRRLTERDDKIIKLLNEHRAMTAEQIARALFPNATRARHRLLALTQRGVLARFRHCRRPGSAPWHYTLGVIGAAAEAARTGQRLPRPSEITDRVIRLHQSPTLPHLLNVNDFFTRLLACAREQPARYRLRVWWPESQISDECGDLVRPDGYGEWVTAEDPPDPQDADAVPRRALVACFCLEHDRGTEPVGALLDKISRYRQLAEAGIEPVNGAVVLFHLPGLSRERQLHRQILRRYGGRRPLPPVATSTHQLCEALGPAGRVWCPVGRTDRFSLAELGRDVADTHRAP